MSINTVGNVIQATPNSVAYAVLEQGGNLNSKLQASLIDGSSQNVWPLSGYTYFIVRKNAHIGNCDRRKQAMHILYNFYFSPTVQSIALRHGFATLPRFVAKLVTDILIHSVKCTDGTYALADLMTTAVTDIAVTSFMKPALSVYQPVYAALDKDVTFGLVNSDLSIDGWSSFLNNPITYGSAFTYFPSASKKTAVYSQLKDKVLTSALVHVPVVIGKSLSLLCIALKPNIFAL